MPYLLKEDVPIIAWYIWQHYTHQQAENAKEHRHN